jgi:type II secretory pathway pseudopilin PulG
MSAPGRALGSEQGLTLIEVLIGTMIMVAIAAAMAMGLINNEESALATQRQAQVVTVLQDRTEWVRQLLRESYTSKGFSAVALTQNPAKGEQSSLPSNPPDPNDYITHYGGSGYTTAGASGTPEGFRIEKNYNNIGEELVKGATSDGETLEVDPTNGKVPPVSYVDLLTGKSFTSEAEVPAGHPYAIVNTYVTVAKEVVSSAESSCTTTAGTGSNSNDARRVIVAARIHPSGPSNADVSTPQYATTLLTNPIPSNQCQSSTGLEVHFNIE